MPMPRMAPGAARYTDSIASRTAAKPVAASPVAIIGTRVLCVMTPAESTRPAATLVPPISTPMVCRSLIRPPSNCKGERRGVYWWGHEGTLLHIYRAAGRVAIERPDSSAAQESPASGMESLRGHLHAPAEEQGHLC